MKNIDKPVLLQGVAGSRDEFSDAQQQRLLLHERQTVEEEQQQLHVLNVDVWKQREKDMYKGQNSTIDTMQGSLLIFTWWMFKIQGN